MRQWLTKVIKPYYTMWKHGRLNETTCQTMSNKVKTCQNMVALVTMA